VRAQYTSASRALDDQLRVDVPSIPDVRTRSREEHAARPGGFPARSRRDGTWLLRLVTALAAEIAGGCPDDQGLFSGSRFPIDSWPPAHDINPHWLFTSVLRSELEPTPCRGTTAAISGFVHRTRIA